jgi:hypothetical protein
MYVLSDTIWLSDGMGTMDAQNPNEYGFMIEVYASFLNFLRSLQ